MENILFFEKNIMLTRYDIFGIENNILDNEVVQYLLSNEEHKFKIGYHKKCAKHFSSNILNIR